MSAAGATVGHDTRRLWLALGLSVVALLLLSALWAPPYLSTPDPALAGAGPLELLPFGADDRGVPLVEYALQGAAILTVPALAAGGLVMVLAALAGLLRCTGGGRLHGALDVGVHVGAELVSALPRWVVVLVVALMLPRDAHSLLPIALVWALLAAPGAMDEAAAAAERLGGERFVEALHAHGFSWSRIYLGHVVARNLRPVLVRQGAEVSLQVVYLELALSYLAVTRQQPSWTHPDSQHSWASLLYQGYAALLGHPTQHVLVLALGLVGVVVVGFQALRLAARGR